MHNKTRFQYWIIIVAIIFVALPNFSKAQTSISSPYSRFGIGETNVFNNAINNAMGGVGYAYRRNNSINYMNPASYAGIDTTSFVFDVGYYTEWITLSNNQYKSSGNKAGLSHLLVGFPIGNKFKFALGLIPMSSVEFSTSETIIDTVLGKHTKSYESLGGLNKALLGISFAPIKNLSIGVNLEYVFGNYYKSSTIAFPDSTYMYSSRVENNYHVNAFNFNLGLQYFQPLSNGDKIGIGVVYDLPSKFPTDNVLSRYTFTTNAGLEYMKDSIHKENSSNSIEYPSTIGLGLSYEKPNKLFIGIDGRYMTWSDFKFQSNYQNTYFVNNFKVSLGGEWRPDIYGNYFQKSIYRFGVFYDNGMLEFNNNNRINEMGVSFGIGLPIKKSNTMINLSFEYLNKGTKENNLIEEDYFRIGLSFSAKDLWFFKRKYQ
ncbi:MAG: hypothetical protein PHI14_05155 [Bacteroidales bacterium]|nr:hypothetical protein [Bacteroidales bacterium]